MTENTPEWQASQPLISEETQPLIRTWKEIGDYGEEEFLTIPHTYSLWNLLNRDEAVTWMYAILLIAGVIEVHVLHTYATLLGWSVLYITNRSR